MKTEAYSDLISKITLEDVKESHYTLKQLKSLRMKLDFSEVKIFRVMCIETGKTIACFDSLSEVRMFTASLKAQKGA